MRRSAMFSRFRVRGSCCHKFCTMLILNIDTSTDICSAALGLDGKLLAFREDRSGVNHARRLPVFVDELLAQARSRQLPIDAVAVSSGPGSYTGLRIGVSTAKGLCYGLGVPLLAVETLAVVAAAAVGSDGSLSDAGGNSQKALPTLICPMIDARRMEVYTALYDAQLQRLTDVEAKVIDEHSFEQVLAANKVIFCGNGAAKCESVISSDNACFLNGTAALAQQMVELSYQKMLNYESTGLGAEDVAYFTPFYLKDFQAAPSHVKGLS